jgi:hypothetical protein
MKAPQGGYTVLEVMLFLAISSIIFALTVTAFKGQYSSNEFNASMNDVASKVKQYIDEVENGSSGSTANFETSNVKCSVVPSALAANGRPKLTPGSGSDLGTNSDCVFLGKAIHFNKTAPYNSFIYVYPILGRRLYNSGGETVPVDTLAASNPEPAVGTAVSGQVDLTEVYRIPHGARVIYAKDVTSNRERYFAGMFTSLNQFNATTNNGSSNIISVLYPFNGTTPPADQPPGGNATLISCLEFSSAACKITPVANPFPLSKWEVCFASTPDGNRGLLTFTSNAGFGLQTDLVIGKLDVC